MATFHVHYGVDLVREAAVKGQLLTESIQTEGTILSVSHELGHIPR